MNTGERRGEILKILKQTEVPIAARELAGRFGVSRQVIVQDLAVIRASTPGILSTTKGYVMQQDSSCTREFKVRHSQDKAAQELNLIVDCGGHVKNISISHRVYGRVSAEMDIRSRQDVSEFIQALQNSRSTVLSSATSGYHYHLIEASSEERLDLIRDQLEKAGFLAPLQPWEQQSQRLARFIIVREKQKRQWNMFRIICVYRRLKESVLSGRRQRPTVIHDVSRNVSRGSGAGRRDRKSPFF